MRVTKVSFYILGLLTLFVAGSASAASFWQDMPVIFKYGPNAARKAHILKTNETGAPYPGGG